MKTNRRIIFRADGNSRIGLGHVVRSLALAAMLRDEFECVFAIQEPDEALKEQILQTCHGLITLPVCAPSEERFSYELAAYISEEEIVVLDGYNFGSEYQQTIKSRDAVLVCLDDLHAYPFVADVVLNQAGGVEASNYRTAPYTKLLPGPEYALLRAPFLKASKTVREFPNGQLNILLNLGGADPDNHTLHIARELADKLTGATIQVVVGSAYKHLPELQDWLSTHKNYKLHQNLSAADMQKLMERCAIAITSASGVAYEYAAVGGVLFVKQTAANQAGLYKFLTETGIAQVYTSEALKQNFLTQFEVQVALQRQYFDGNSDERLRQVFRQLSQITNLTLRNATIVDLQLVFDWNNDPEVRQHSFNPEPILIENHTRWYKTKLEDANCKFYIAEVNGTPAAQIRYDMNGDTATISYLISKGFRGRGLGHTILQKGISKLKREAQIIKTIVGLVQQDNIASVRAFEKAGFAYGTPDKKHPDAHRFVLQLP
ncbi:UDP-2,4-diacetamido-2,4,6-trideoxy-beta-L-altropyranose hydrolase [Pontibacter pudoricolor]|uniref:UDP-2,4-diacetamido-2,4, 6-trideoxy-beta-L-altropyranose hydrolase n=1 Tax=Pontibacter pudoricolor TaxID=2694930 RepID=UPI001390D062|nr:UDP-2,4-diacetamido-2,4,6-trideoxy-beta-L-altropyranose hydrolase [Pontibacter pudoricolor]